MNNMNDDILEKDVIEYSTILDNINIRTEKKIASVKVTNSSSKKIVSVSVGHKYSNVYKNQHDFSSGIDLNKSSDSFDVEYNIGITTTGRDWWVITWITEDGEIRITSPNNFRAIFDCIERIATKIGTPLVALGGYFAKKQTKSDKLPEWVVALAAIATAAIIESFLNSESTDGYKQHILRKGDSLDNEIVIFDNEVVFKSKSGVSKTVFKVIKPPKK